MFVSINSRVQIYAKLFELAKYLAKTLWTKFCGKTFCQNIW